MTNKATDDEIIIKEVANADILLHDLRDHFLGKHSGYLGLTTDYSLGRKKNDIIGQYCANHLICYLYYKIFQVVCCSLHSNLFAPNEKRSCNIR